MAPVDLTLAGTKRRAEALVAGGALVAGAALGVALVALGPVASLALLVGIGAVAACLRSVWVAFAGVLAVMALLPYATLPVGAAVTPALLEVAQLATLGLLVAVVLIDRRQRIATGWPEALVVALLGVTTFAFGLGLGRGYTPQTAHDFFKFLISICVFWVVVQLVRELGHGRWTVNLLLLATGAAASLGLALYAAGPALTERVLVRLVPYGYPGGRIVRYIEDDPSRPMRAVGTSVDPNSFGGLLMVGFVLAVGQIVVRRRSAPVAVAGSVAGLTGLAMLLTYSRGAWVGAFAGVVLLLALRRPLLLVPLGALGAAAVALGVGAGFVERLWLGFTLQDPATRLRLAEYRNALAIIREHPIFGVGFGDAPSIELQTGVSSIYLTIWQRAGLVGLALFLIAMAVILTHGMTCSRRAGDERSDLALCFTAALVAALTVGLVDHYFFNPQFPQMATLLWVIGGAVVALARVNGTSTSRERVSSARETLDADGRAARLAPEPGGGR